MKKAAWFAVLLVLVLGLFTTNIKSVNAQTETSKAVSGCAAGWLFNPNTGARCENSGVMPGCDLGYQFSPFTGQYCTNYKSEDIKPVPVPTPVPTPGTNACNSLPCVFDGKAITNTWGTVDTPPSKVSAKYPYEFTLKEAAKVQLVLRSNVWPKSPDTVPENTMYVELDKKVVFKESKTYDEYQDDETNDNTINTIKLGELAPGKHTLKIYAFPDPEHFMFDWFRLEYLPGSTLPLPQEPMPSFKVVLPKSRTYNSSDTINVAWTPYKGNFDYYYVMLGNKYAGVEDNISPDKKISKRSTSYKITNVSALIEEILANSGGKTADQIQHGYYVTVQPAKINPLNGHLEPIAQSASSQVFTILMDEGDKDDENNSAPEFISWSTDSPEGQVVGKNIQFTFSAKDADNDGLTWRINWGDGSPEDWASSCETYQGDWNHVASKVWYKAGIYKIKVTIGDCNGGSHTEVLPAFTVASGVVSEPYITVLSPNGGEKFSLSDYIAIKWEGYDTRYVSLGLISSSGKLVGYIFPTGPLSTSQAYNAISWIPQDGVASRIGGSKNITVSPGDYKIEICRGEIVCDRSDSSFKIVSEVVATPVLQVLSPNGGESWAIGSQQKIVWQDKTSVATCTAGATGCYIMPQIPKYYDVLLEDQSSCYQESCSNFLLAEGVTSPNYWTVGKYDGDGRAISAGSYKVKVCQSGTNICDSSDSYFKITSGDTASVCPLSATAQSRLSSNSTNSWGFDVLVNKIVATNADGWVADNFEGYFPKVYAYGTKVHFGEFFVDSGPLTFTARDNQNASCRTTIMVYPPPVSGVPIIQLDQEATNTTPLVLGEKTFTFTQKLELGSAGNEVVELQKYLAGLGLYNGSYDGKFGASTKTAVVKFQNVNHLTPDGIVGAEVRNVLNSK